MEREVVEYLERRETVLAGVRRILIENLDVRREPDEIDPDAPLFGTGLGLDSVDSVELVVSLETTFGVRIPNEVVGRQTMRTVNTLVDFVLDRKMWR